MPPLDHDRCYAAASSRDARFDGTFVIAVRTTGIYCRPSCPAVTPKRANVDFYRTAAAAQQHGFRACKRCRPDATPGSPEWNVRQDVVGRAMRLIADGVIERGGVPDLARRLGYSERHLNRMLTSEVGAGPLALARAQRAQTARILVETTDMRLTDIAFAAGFGSVRQFNDTMRAVFASSPSGLRSASAARGRRGRTTASPRPTNGTRTVVMLRLPARRPFPAVETLDFVGRRSVPGVETFEIDPTPGVARRYRLAMRLAAGTASVTIEIDRTALDEGRDTEGDDGVDRGAGVDHLVVAIELDEVADLGAAVQRLRRVFDLDADPVAVDDHLAGTALATSVRARRGRRSPAGLDPFEVLVRAIVGQQISVAGARAVLGRLVGAVTDVPPEGVRGVDASVPFPDPASIADAPDEAFAMPASRRDTLRRCAAAVASGDLPLDVGADHVDIRRRLLAIRGIGPWTADYVTMRGLAHPDVLMCSDLVVKRVVERLGSEGAALGTRATPWGSYATHHLWALAGESAPGPDGRTR